MGTLLIGSTLTKLSNIMDIQDYQNQQCSVIEEQQSETGLAIMTNQEIERTNCTNKVLFTGSYDQCLEYSYPVQDDTWPSRKWNTAKTDYIDLSGW